MYKIMNLCERKILLYQSENDCENVFQRLLNLLLCYTSDRTAMMRYINEGRGFLSVAFLESP